MARQKGIIKLKGTMGDITFYRSGDGYMAREKGGVSAERIQSDPRYQRTRENNAEFGRAGTAGKVFRASIQSMLRTSSDSRMVSRLTREMVKVIQMDETNPRGLRNVIDGEAELLLGFEFNIQGKLKLSISAPFTTSCDRVTGEAVIEIAPFIPMESLSAPSGSTHYQIVSAAMDINFEKESFVAPRSSTPIQPIDTVMTTAVQLENALPAASINPQFIILGVNFFQEVNGAFYELKSGAYNSLQVVYVNGTP